MIYFDFFKVEKVSASEYVPLSGTDNPLIQNLLNVENSNFDRFFDGMYKFGIAIAIILAVIMIIVGGIQYMTTDAISDKGEGRKKIQGAFIGLLIAVSSFAILYTINPDILTTSLNFQGLKTRLENNIPNYESVGGTFGGGGSNSGGISPIDPSTAGRYTAMPAEYEQYMRQRMIEMGFQNLNPRDASDFFSASNGNTPEGRLKSWTELMSTIAKYESGHRSNLTYTENFTDDSGNRVVSTGLFQLSQESSRGYGFRGITTEQLKDPYKNIDVALTIMKRWVINDGYISGPNNTGGARYWSVLRETGKKSRIRGETLFGNTQTNQ